jgi:EAL domain-containing protein (putative c-di-GMP-specific phosphodiesterase class I)
MPGMDGIELLKSVRARDLDVPVVLATGAPSIETAAKAVEYGALLYLVKPIPPKTLVEVIGHAARLHRLARLKRDALAHLGGDDKQVGDRAGLEAALERAMEGMWMAFQPIVDLPRRSVHGFEALMRSTEPLLPHPGAVIEAAERLLRLRDVGRRVRSLVATAIDGAEEGPLFFVNLHPHDLLDEDLFSEAAPLSRHASRVVLEITERATLDKVKNVSASVDALRRLGFRIAIDDLGAGYAGLSAFAELRPEVVKLDMSLIRGIDRDTIKQKLVRSMVSVCREMEMTIIAEGVETKEERASLDALGADLLQGYLFAKPGKGFPAVNW